MKSIKNIKYLILTLFTVIAISSCTDTDNDELTLNAQEGGLANINNLLISYVVGSGSTYTATGFIQQGNITTNTVKVYNQHFYQVVLQDINMQDSIGFKNTDKVLLETINIENPSSGQVTNFSASFDYVALSMNLVKDDGTSLPANDGTLTIGDYWQLTYESTTSEGNIHANTKATKIAVGTRYAGVYVAEDTAYWRIGAAGGSWDAQEVIIESVNATVYRHVGIAHWTDGNEYYFTVDNTTGVITVLGANLSGTGTLLNDQPIMTCAINNGFTILTCDNTTSLAEPDDVNGKDVLNLTVGYLTAGSGPREFFEKLVKKVD
jgi:hypothetical protein